MLPDISVLETADRGLPCLYEHFLIIIQFPFLSAVLLQDDQVTAHLRTRVVREEVVRQACDTHRIGMSHHILAYGRVGRGIQHPCEVMNATIPPLRTASSPLRKK